MNVEHRQRGRPKLGDCRIEFMVPQAVMDELLRREREGQGYRTRIAANVLSATLIGQVTAPDGSLHRIAGWTAGAAPKAVLPQH